VPCLNFQHNHASVGTRYWIPERAAGRDPVWSFRAERQRSYAKAFRQIVSDIFGFSDSPEKYDYRGGGWAKWLASVHAVKLVEVTPARV
jgi:hypothetical protein